MREEVKYCIYCGAENDAGGDACQSCGKTLSPKENLFVEYLIRKTKDKLKDEATGTVLDAIKNYLLSHLYGTVVTVSILAVTVATVVGSGGGNIVDLRPDESFVRNRYETFNELVNQYFHELKDFNQELNPDMVAEYYSYRLPDSYVSGEKHEATIDRLEEYDLDWSGTIPGEVVIDPAAPRTEAGRQLQSQGYTIAELEVEERYGETRGFSYGYYTWRMGSRTYLFTGVQIDGVWYIADERVIDDAVNKEESWGYGSWKLLYDHCNEITGETSGRTYEIYLEQLLPDSYSYTAQAVRELTLSRAPEGTTNLSSITDYTVVNPADPQRELTARMMKDGFLMAEGTREETYYQSKDDGTQVELGKTTYLVTMTRIDGKWYVVESVALD